MQGAAPLASPGLNLRGTGSTCRCRRLNGGVPPALLARRALAVPGGGLPSLSPAAPVFSLLFCPLSPRPPSPPGKGETQSLFRRGLRPRHPGTEPLAALTEPVKKMPSGGLAPVLLACLAAAVPSGGACPGVAGLPLAAAVPDGGAGAGKYAKGGGGRRQRGKTTPCSCALQKNFQKPLTEAAQYDIIAKRCQDSGKGHGGVAQLARATGSYPVGHRFKSGLRYHIGQGSAVPYPSGTALVRGFPPGPLVKRPKTPPFHGGNSSSNLLRVTK